MSYLVLARKYRPRNFSEMVGQGHVVQALSNALNTQRLHHAYLFTGTRGVGKTTVSRILAKSLNCQGTDGQGGITANPCGVCQACRDIDSGRFVDYTELDAASNRGVDEVQSLLEQAVYKPVQGRFKVFMIDEVHMLTNTAFNAMLKTLEEPPEYLKFVLATTDPQKVPVTVLSRCLQFNLRPMAPKTICEHLEKVLLPEGVAFDGQALRLLAQAAHGSMRDALSLTDQAIAFGSGRLDEAMVRQMLGSVDRSYVFRLIEALAAGDGKTVVEVSETLRINGLSAASTLEEMTAVLQRMAVFQAVPSHWDADDTDPDAGDVARLAQLMPADETQLLYSICLHGRGELGLAPDEYAALTMVLLRMLAFKSIHEQRVPQEKKTLNYGSLLTPKSQGQSLPGLASPELPSSEVTDKRVKSVVFNEEKEVLALENSAQEAIKIGASESNRPVHQLPVVSSSAASDRTHQDHHLPLRDVEPAEQALVKMGAVPVRVQADSRAEALAGQSATQVLIPGEEGDFWFQTVNDMASREQITALVRELALQSQLIARDTDQWLLRVEMESLNQASARERLTAALQDSGYAVRLAIEVGRVTDTPARRNAAALAETQLVAEQIIFDDSFVQTMMREFAAKIVPGSIKPG